MREQAEYAKLLQTNTLNADKVAVLGAVVKKLQDQSVHYKVSDKIPWQLLATLHQMECGADLNRQILNGEPWNRKTQLVPKNMGPWNSFMDSLRDAIEYKFPRYTVEWTLPFCLFFIEQWNGWGYFNRGVQSPYLWAGTNHGEGVGKFVADGKYDRTAKSSQLGAAAILEALMAAEGMPTGIVQIHYDASGSFFKAQEVQVRRLQEFLNAIHAEARNGATVTEALAAPPWKLKEDGKAGPKTDQRFFETFGSHLLGYHK